VYRFPSPDDALLGALLYGSALGIDNREARELAGLPVPPAPVERNPLTRLIVPGAILIALQLSAAHWYFFYIAWFMPGVLLAVLAVGGRAPREAEHDAAGLDEWAPALTPTGAAAPASRRAALS